jgi:transposase
MAIVGGLDVHRQQITFDCVDTDTGEVSVVRSRPRSGGRLRRGWRGGSVTASTAVSVGICRIHRATSGPSTNVELALC